MSPGAGTTRVPPATLTRLVPEGVSGRGRSYCIRSPPFTSIIVPVTKARLDLGPWQRIFYGEWDGQRPKRVILKAIGM